VLAGLLLAGAAAPPLAASGKGPPGTAAVQGGQPQGPATAVTGGPFLWRVPGMPENVTALRYGHWRGEPHLFAALATVSTAGGIWASLHRMDFKGNWTLMAGGDLGRLGGRELRINLKAPLNGVELPSGPDAPENPRIPSNIVDFAVAPDGRTVFTLEEEHCVFVASDPEAGPVTIRKLAGTGREGNDGGGPERLAGKAELSEPQCVALTRDGQVLVTDTGNQLVRVISGMDPASARIDTLASLDRPTGLWVDQRNGQEEITVADHRGLWRMSSAAPGLAVLSLVEGWPGEVGGMVHLAGGQDGVLHFHASGRGPGKLTGQGITWTPPAPLGYLHSDPRRRFRATSRFNPRCFAPVPGGGLFAAERPWFTGSCPCFIGPESDTHLLALVGEAEAGHRAGSPEGQAAAGAIIRRLHRAVGFPAEVGYALVAKAGLAGTRRDPQTAPAGCAELPCDAQEGVGACAGSPVIAFRARLALHELEARGVPVGAYLKAEAGSPPGAAEAKQDHPAKRPRPAATSPQDQGGGT
jgi:DNA-binding beta-propeller fold protein YncE